MFLLILILVFLYCLVLNRSDFENGLEDFCVSFKA